ncbi:MAG: DUF2332 domain-containing protein [Hyphomicrobiales bacterium]|nr:DUF2332 domain-containing protein [Hyphomicrobiales bacterium]
MKNPAIITHFHNQANACYDMGSPFTGLLCRQLIDLLDENTATGRRIENWPGDPAADALALRLCGALHSIVISNPSDPLGKIYPDGKNPHYADILSSAIKTHDETLCSWLDLPPQTNETGRAAALFPGLLEISRRCKAPLQLVEIGSSAGLNLQLEKFYYRFGETGWGDPGSPVALNPVMRGKLPVLSGELDISSRTGCDLSPIDVADEFQQLRLRSYIWPDHQHRSDRLDGAIKLALNSPPLLKTMDAADFVESQLTGRSENTAFVLLHSVVWQYLPQTTQQRIENTLHEYGSNTDKSSPVYWLRLEGLGGKEPEARLMLDSWPGHNAVVLARSCFHSSWIEFV